MTRRECTSVTKATYTQPLKVRTYVMSATHSSFGPKAAKCRFTRSAGHCSRGADRVVRGDLARRTPCRPMSRMRRSTVHRAT